MNSVPRISIFAFLTCQPASRVLTVKKLFCCHIPEWSSSSPLPHDTSVLSESEKWHSVLVPLREQLHLCLPKWPKMTKNDQKWPKMTQNDQNDRIQCAKYYCRHMNEAKKQGPCTIFWVICVKEYHIWMHIHYTTRQFASRPPRIAKRGRREEYYNIPQQ